MKDANGLVAGRPATRRTRGSRFGKATAAAGLLVGALLLGWALTRPSFVHTAQAPVAHEEARAENPADPTGASIPVAADGARGRLQQGDPNPRTPPGPCRPRMSPRRLPPNRGRRRWTRRRRQDRRREGPAPVVGRRANVTPSESIPRGARPSAALSEPPRPGKNAPPAPALDLPVQALSVPAVKTAPAAVDPSSGSVAPVTLPSPAPAAHTAAPAPAAPARRAEADATAVRGVLEGYASAYSALDAEATQRLWPGVDLRGLRRAFEQLSAQTVHVRPMRREAGGRLGRGRVRGSHHLGAPSRRSVAALRSTHLAIRTRPRWQRLADRARAGEAVTGRYCPNA